MRKLLYHIIVTLLLVCFSSSVLAQRYDWRDKIDQLVHQADSLFNKSQKTFYSLRYLKNEQAIKETWYYTLQEGKIIIFQLRYLIDDTEFNEVYYLNRGSLVCMEQYESPVKLSDEEIRKAEVYYFVGSEMKQYVHYGRQQRGYPAFTSGNECLEKFEKRYAELLRNMKHTPNMGNY